MHITHLKCSACIMHDVHNTRRAYAQTALCILCIYTKRKEPASCFGGGPFRRGGDYSNISSKFLSIAARSARKATCALAKRGPAITSGVMPRTSVKLRPATSSEAYRAYTLATKRPCSSSDIPSQTAVGRLPSSFFDRRLDARSARI